MSTLPPGPGMPPAEAPLQPQPAGDFFASDTKVEYQQYGRSRWRMGYPESEGDVGRIYYRVLPPEWVPGLQVAGYPVMYYVHPIPNAMRGKPGDRKTNVFCMGSPKTPDPNTREWPLDEAGVQECSRVVVHGGVLLHSATDPVQRFLIAVFQYTDGPSAVNELRFWEPKVSRQNDGLWAQMKAAQDEAKRQGSTLADVVCSVEKRMQGSYARWSINVHPAPPNSEYAQRFPFGDAQRHVVQSMAPKFVENFLPYRDLQGVLNQLQMDGSTQSAAPPLPSGTAGPQAARPGMGSEI